jgi:hypothetical protein
MQYGLGDYEAVKDPEVVADIFNTFFWQLLKI